MSDAPNSPKKPTPPAPPKSAPKSASPPVAGKPPAPAAKPSAQPPVAKPVAGKPPAAKPTVAKPLVAKPAQFAAPTDKVPADKPAAEKASAPRPAAPPKAAPGTVRAVKPPPEPEVEDDEIGLALPVGKLVAPPAPKPPVPPDDMELDFDAFAAPAPVGRSAGRSASHSPAALGRRKDSTPAIWIGVGIGAVVVAVLVAVLLLRGDDKKPAVKTADATHAKAAAKEKEAEATDNPAETKDKVDKDKDATEKEKGAKPTEANATKDKPAGEKDKAAEPSTKDKPATDKPATKPGDASAGATSGSAATDGTGGDKKPEASGGPKKPTRPVRRGKGAPIADAMPVSQQFRGIEEVAKADAPEALKKFIAESAEMLNKGEFQAFFESHVDPRDRGELPTEPVATKRGANDFPYDVLEQGKLRVTAMFTVLSHHQPRMFEDGKIAVYDLSARTRPTFVLHEDRWYLSRGLATSMEKRFKTLSSEEEVVYLLETTTGKKGAIASDPMFTGEKKTIADKIAAIGGVVALLNNDEDIKRSAVIMTSKYSGGPGGFSLLKDLHEIAPVVALVVAPLKSDDSEDNGFTEADITQEVSGLKALEYLRWDQLAPAEEPISIHLQDMTNLRRLIANAGAITGEEIVRDFDKITDLNEITLRVDQATDSLANAMKKLPTLRSVNLESRKSTVTDETAAALREAIPGLWIDY